jgi:putative intracellular protease/amidase
LFISQTSVLMTRVDRIQSESSRPGIRETDENTDGAHSARRSRKHWPQDGLGATFEKVADWQPLSVVDGRLITGQNPASSTVAAQNLVNLLAAEKAA